ncbi:hypothetical protein ANO11243_041450 [Dothideomycetidae sp. 11243]|nr:hypothetical protein ANO11243_041450 [fungal sp. No.11243]
MTRGFVCAGGWSLGGARPAMAAAAADGVWVVLWWGWWSKMGEDGQNNATLLCACVPFTAPLRSTPPKGANPSIDVAVRRLHGVCRASCFCHPATLVALPDPDDEATPPAQPGTGRPLAPALREAL